MIRLEEITEENWIECIGLKEEENARKFIASNLFSIAQAQFYPKAISRAIYNDQTMVGYTLHGEDEDEHDMFHIDRLMIGLDYRNNGFASETLQLIINEASEKGYNKLAASVHPENKKMHNLLGKFGFEFRGEYDDDEMVFRRVSINNK
ncbi:GNAT family N-acetyltransferase [Alkaliphilus hydrothermalis]|uniref:Diamine N-acetyltransferase n=1 Tax=Alkaliphilus hydrothermalis TaxID=1482730 RepID=A0ABS2NPK4_9FIRM|nr:GNAT family N-acetyltransferase [Alkaliphilus hydrothermalis]MBM7614881.1 diamine N-acetyltransferase [Alkaliphilus hydrothermalis]